MSTSKPSIADSIFQDEEQDTFRDHIGTVDSAGEACLDLSQEA